MPGRAGSRRQPRKQDHPGVVVPPPVVAVAVVIGGLILDWAVPAYLIYLLVPIEIRVLLGVVMVAGGLALSVAAMGAFRAAHTNVEPWKPSLVLVTGGVFRWLRNPMYVGGALILAGVSVAFALDWMLVLTILSFAVIHVGVVRREERYLADKFGPAYAAYRAKVSRYGWPF